MEIPKVAATVIQRDFGADVHRVASELLSRGPCRVDELGKWVAEGDQVKVLDALGALGRNELVRKDEAGKYVVDAVAVTRRWRFPYFSSLVLEEFGSEAQFVLELFMVHGKVTSKQMYASANDRAKRAEAIATLVREKIVAPLRGKESAKPGSLKRKREGSDDEGENGMPATITLNSQKPTTVRLPGHDDEATVWSVNFAQLEAMSTMRICVDLVRSVLDADCAAIMQMILKQTLIRGGNIMSASFSGASEEKVTAEFEHVHTGKSASDFRDKVKLMCREETRFVKRANEYLYAEVTDMLELVRRKTTEDIVLRRFGSDARRMFCLLLYKKKLEAKQAADLSMLSHKKAREVMFNLYENGFATVQEVPRSNDFKQSRCLYIWSVDLPRVYAQVEEHMDRSCLNLYRRLALLEKQGGEANAELDRKRRELLESSILRIHITLMLYRDLK